MSIVAPPRSGRATRARYAAVRRRLGEYDARQEVAARLYAFYVVAVMSLMFLPIAGAAAKVLLDLTLPSGEIFRGALIAAPLVAALAALVGRWATLLRISAPQSAFLLAGQFPCGLVVGMQAGVIVAGWGVAAAAVCLALTYGNGWSAANVAGATCAGAGLATLAGACTLVGLTRWRLTVAAACAGLTAVAAVASLTGLVAPLVGAVLVMVLGVGGGVGLTWLTLATLDVERATALTIRRERLLAALMFGDQRQIRRVFEPRRIWWLRATLRVAAPGPHWRWTVILRRDAWGWLRDLPGALIASAVVIAACWVLALMPPYGLGQVVVALVLYAVVGRLFAGAQAHLDNAMGFALWPWSYAKSFALHLISPGVALVLLAGLGVCGASLWGGADTTRIVSALVICAMVLAARLWVLTAPAPPPDAFLSAPAGGTGLAKMLAWCLRGWIASAVAVLAAAAAAYATHTPAGGVLAIVVLAGVGIERTVHNLGRLHPGA